MVPRVASALMPGHGNRAGALVRLQRGEHVPAGHVGQVQIEQDHVRQFPARDLDALGPAHRRQEPHLRMLRQHVLHQTQVRRIVLYI